MFILLRYTSSKWPCEETACSKPRMTNLLQHVHALHQRRALQLQRVQPPLEVLDRALVLLALQPLPLPVLLVGPPALNPSRRMQLLPGNL